MPKPKRKKGRTKLAPIYSWEPEVKPQGDLAEFLVQSEGDPALYYAVNIMAYNGHGRCTCEDYEVRVAPMRSRGIEPVHESCKHIKKCREYLGFEVAKKLARSYLKKNA